MMYSIAEMFVSPQGEGLYTGALMQFVRLAGCTVGRPIPKEESERLGLPFYMELCHAIGNRPFYCDTNFQRSARMEAPEILAAFLQSHAQHLCITGGEPLVQDLRDLLFVMWSVMPRMHSIHIETSGTRMPIGGIDTLKDAWVTISPKEGAYADMLERADELKLLVDETFEWDALPEQVRTHPLVWLQPINDEHALIPQNVERCLKLQREHPECRLSLQMHKVIGVR